MPYYRIKRGRLALPSISRKTFGPGEIVCMGETQAAAYGIERLDRIDPIINHNTFVTNPSRQSPAPADYSVTSAAATLALENGVNLSSLTGTGADGKITVADVRAAMGGGNG